jgi:hypothetical protein
MDKMIDKRIKEQIDVWFERTDIWTDTQTDSRVDEQ